MLGSPQLFYNIGRQNFSLWQSVIKQSTQQRGERKSKERKPKVQTKSPKTQSGSQRAKEQIMFQAPPPITKSISKREMKFEKVGSIEEPSLAMGNAPQNRNEQVLRLKFSC
jgi:hypothetical protein